MAETSRRQKATLMGCQIGPNRYTQGQFVLHPGETLTLPRVCKLCKHWKHVPSTTKPSRGHCHHPKFVEIHDESAAMPEDGVGVEIFDGYAEVVVGASFGCIHHEVCAEMNGVHNAKEMA